MAGIGHRGFMGRKKEPVGLPFIFSVTVGSGQSFQLPTISDGTYDCIIDWGDTTSNTLEVWNAAGRSHTYAVGGTYDIQISGVFDGWSVNQYSDRLKISEVKQWGILLLGSGLSAFRGCSNMTVSATDILDTSTCTSFTNLFLDCTLISTVPNIEIWNTSLVTNMALCFYGCTNFNSPLDGWDVSSVTQMHGMFYNASSFNQNLNSWVTTSLTDVNIGGISMFRNATSFNGEINNWDMSGVSIFTQMFYGASSFNQDINDWDMSSATITREMFRGCSMFNGDISNWDVSNVENMSNMFLQAFAFNQDIGGWVTSSCTNMEGMFRLTSFNQDISGWDVSSVTSMALMFNNNTAFNQPIGAWTTSSLQLLSAGSIGTFEGATSFDQDLSNWDVSNVTNGVRCFRFATLSTPNYDALLIGWASQPVQSGVNFHFGDSQYTSGGAAEAARNTLISTYGWTITDGGAA